MMMGPGHAHMMAVHDRMNEMLAAFSRQFFEGIRRQMHRQHHLAMHRPAGHDSIAHMGQAKFFFFNFLHTTIEDFFSI